LPGGSGEKGKDGLDGKDGLGVDDLTLEHDGERTVTVKAIRGEQVKTIGTVVFPVAIYRGIYVEGKAYSPGDSVTWAGSEWHCHTPTASKPGDGSKAWTLKVKRGRDGKDGQGGPRGPEGPAGKDWQQVYDDTRRGR
jgi:integrin beta 3